MESSNYNLDCSFIDFYLIVKCLNEAEIRPPQLLIEGYNNSVMSCDDISIDQFVPFFTQHVITRISSRVPFHCTMFY